MKVKWDDIETITSIISTSSNKRQVINSMGYSIRSGRSYNMINSIIKQYGLDISHFNYGVDYALVLPDAVAASICVSDVIRQVGLKPVGRNETTIKRWIIKLDLDTSHSDVSAAKGKRSAKSYSEIFGEDSTVSNGVIRAKILREKLLPYTCDECMMDSMWNGKILTLQLDHINGISNDNRLLNLRFLCPNCHTQTPTWGNRN